LLAGEKVALQFWENFVVKYVFNSYNKENKWRPCSQVKSWHVPSNSSALSKLYIMQCLLWGDLAKKEFF
jgi:hypothetical protein